MDDRGVLQGIIDELAASGVGLISGGQRMMLGTFIREVTLWSGRIHLVGRSNISRTIGSLVVDSWMLYRLARDRGILRPAGGEGPCGAVRVADIGSGAGFPGVVWKIADPGLDVALFERREKPLRFLERAVVLLGLEGIHVRDEDVGIEHESTLFDVVVSKAAGRLPDVAPIAALLLRRGGAYLTVKGRGWEGEISRIAGPVLRLTASEELPGGRGTMLAFIREESRKDE
jgi:16S rRNA (guanine(527)-N(7))-methyltransferase RsmG